MGIQTIPFAVSLPTSTLQDFDEPNPKEEAMALMGDTGIVGSIVLMGEKLAMIWVGWGQIQYSSSKAAANTVASGSLGRDFGKGAPIMGQLLVSMPRTHYRGAFGTGAKEPSTSQLIGSVSNEDQMLANQMASRLSVRSGRAIFISCQLSSAATNGVGPDGSPVSGIHTADSWTTGLNSEMISHKAAALAEKEIWKILQENGTKGR